MKELTYSLIIIFCALSCQSCSKQNGEITIKNELTDFLYIGIPNQILINNQPEKKYTLASNNNVEINKISDGKYTVKASGSGFVTLNIVNEDDEVILSKKYNTKYIPNIKTVLPFQINDERVIGKYEFESSSQIYVETVNYDINGIFKILSFELLIIEPTGKTHNLKSNSSTITEEMKSTTMKAESNSKLLFHKIQYQQLDSTLWVSNPILVTVK